MTSDPLDLLADLIARARAAGAAAADAVLISGTSLSVARRLGKTVFRAYQASRRGGEIICRVVRDRVELEGSCAFYLEGEVEI